MKTYLSLLLLVMLSSSILSPSQIWVWRYTGDDLQPIKPEALHALPREITSLDINQDGITEKLTTRAGQARLIQDSQVIWSSPAGWTVAQSSIADLNRDDLPEMVLLVWRPFKPWPIDRVIPYGGRIAAYQDGSGYSCHIILIGWKNGAFREVWAGSALARPIRSFVTGDVDRDGYPELIAIEGQYTAHWVGNSETLSVWKWNGFGFDLLARQEGRFTQVAIRYNQDHEPIIWTQE